MGSVGSGCWAGQQWRCPGVPASEGGACLAHVLPSPPQGEQGEGAADTRPLLSAGSGLF